MCAKPANGGAPARPAFQVTNIAPPERRAWNGSAVECYEGDHSGLGQAVERGPGRGRRCSLSAAGSVRHRSARSPCRPIISPSSTAPTSGAAVAIAVPTRDGLRARRAPLMHSVARSRLGRRRRQQSTARIVMQTAAAARRLRRSRFEQIPTSEQHKARATGAFSRRSRAYMVSQVYGRSDDRVDCRRASPRQGSRRSVRRFEHAGERRFAAREECLDAVAAAAVRGDGAGRGNRCSVRPRGCAGRLADEAIASGPRLHDSPRRRCGTTGALHGEEPSREGDTLIARGGPAASA